MTIFPMENGWRDLSSEGPVGELYDYNDWQVYRPIQSSQYQLSNNDKPVKLFSTAEEAFKYVTDLEARALGRVSEDFDIPLGTIFKKADKRGDNYIFIGYYTNTVGKEICLAREIQPNEVANPGSPWIYRCAHSKTFLAQFPEAEKFRNAR